MKLLVLAGIFLSPIATLGFVLIHYNHPVLGLVALGASAMKAMLDDKDKEKD